MAQSSTEAEYPKLYGVIIENGVMVQIFQDGMLTFHDLQDQRLLRVMIQHSDSINDLVIKDYDSGEG